MQYKARIVIDIDGVIATGTSEDVYSTEAGWAYEKCTPLEEGIAMVRELSQEGYYLIFHTARWESDRERTVKWMIKNGVPYHELIMGKPSARLYIDDRGLRFTTRPGESLAEARRLLGE